MPEARAVKGVAVALNRVLAATVGGYVLMLSFVTALATVLQRGAHWGRGEAMVSAALGAFAVYLLAALRAFVVSSAWRAWAELLAMAALLAALALAWNWA
ncbi:MAG: iron transporter [Rhodoferax sp.]